MAPGQNTARKTAWLVLNQCDIMKHDAAERLNKLLPQTDRSGQATDIVFGVIRNQTALDSVITKCGSIEPERVKPSIWNLLRIGVYELVYAPKTAEYAIINEAVELAGQKGTKKTAGFINAILRAVQKNIQSRQVSLSGADPRKTLPQDPQNGCAFTTDLLPDPKKESANHLSKAFSLPNWLVAEWLHAYSPQQTRDICCASNRHPSVILQPNTLRISAKQLHHQLTQQGLDCEINSEQTACCLKHSGPINKMPEFLDGIFLIQDSTAANAMKCLNAQPGWNILDLCAAPGGKSIALSMQIQDKGCILASDSDKKRLQKVRQNAERMRISAIEIVMPTHITQKLKKLSALDAVILDVPCSNTGVLARRVEARRRLRKNDITPLLKTQAQLLQQAAAFCQQQTKLVYSTCSIQPEENQQQIRQFMKHHTQFKLITEKLTLPAVQTEMEFDHDGGYVAVMQTR